MKTIKLKSVRVKSIKKLSTQIMDWGIKTLRVYEEWKETRGEGIKVAILDTGIIPHPDLKDNIKGGVGIICDRDYLDKDGHGTHVAGIIAALDNDFGVVGVAPRASLYAVKILGDDGSGEMWSLARGIHWACDNHMDIISMSLGYYSDCEIVHEAVQRAYRQGIPIIAAAGNDGDENTGDNINYPARYPETIAVGSVNKYLKRSDFSSKGEELDIMAPGEDIYSTFLNDEYAILSGTSMATPFITGIVALMIAKHRKNKNNKTPIETVGDVREHLIRTADENGEIGKDNFYGYGIVDIKAIEEE